MLIIYSLEGSNGNHVGLFDSTGFWARFEAEMDMNDVQGYKIYSHFSFAYFHKDYEIAYEVYRGLMKCLSGADWTDHDIGFIKSID